MTSRYMHLVDSIIHPSSMQKTLYKLKILKNKTKCSLFLQSIAIKILLHLIVIFLKKIAHSFSFVKIYNEQGVMYTYYKNNVYYKYVSFSKKKNLF